MGREIRTEVAYHYTSANRISWKISCYRDLKYNTRIWHGVSEKYLWCGSRHKIMTTKEHQNNGTIIDFEY